MTENQIRIQYLVKRLRYKHSDNQNIMQQLDRILWYSIPVVYLNWENDVRQIEHGIDLRKQKKRRTRHYLLDMRSRFINLHFVTFTFNEDVMTSTNDDTRHRYVARFLNEHTRDYYANVDYGSKTQRQHYHAVVALKDYPMPPFPYGYYDIEVVREDKRNNGDLKAISTYINKLANHAGKLGTGRAFHKRHSNGLKECDVDLELPF